ncbi:unnamed protein product [Lepeophtheirus salmonis]|uniref:(salmon louse) hypothetical protein n=1 Tax=Lepeophtheirus salmonis TaxID=72036 RepID=A0A7R8D5R1_LEPSM|nr:unnamed protein product [Lepeophtheirus salmonis]CAF3037633.1 unnamed protein product [Lepeophtheirus salmonis]
MEAEKLGRSLSVFKDKYEAIVKEMSYKANVEQGCDAESEEKAVEHKIGYPDGKFVELPLLNEYTGFHVKTELNNYTTTRKLNPIYLCTALHVVNESSGNSLEKWDIIFQIMDPKNIRKSEKHQDKVLSTVIRCDSMQKFEFKEDPLPSKKDFIATVKECTEKIYIHAGAMTCLLLENGDIIPLYSILGSVFLTLNKLNFYSNYFKEGDSDPFSNSTVTLKKIADTIAKKIIVYHKDVISSVILHEGESNDWNSETPPFEGQRISFNIQFWWYYMSGIRADLYNSLSSTIAKNILQAVLDDSLSILTVRYCQITPNPARMPQFRGDIFAILMVSVDFLLSLVSCLSHLFCPLPIHLASRSIHAKCTALTLALTLMGLPIKILHASIKKDESIVKSNKLDPIEKKSNPLNSHEDELIRWLSLTTLHASSTNNLKLLPNSSFVSILARHASLQPHPEWSLIVRLVLSRNMSFASLVMVNIGAYIPDEDSKPKQSGCNFLMCNRKCIGVAEKGWSQLVGTGILYIVMHGNPEADSLSIVLGPLLRKLSRSSWDILDANLIWNVQKPIWYRALLEILEPYFYPIINDLVEDVDGGKTWTISQVSDAIKKINVNIMDVAYCIPISFYQVCELLETLIPDSIRPLCDSIVVHFFFATVYNIITKLIPIFRKWKMQREKLNFLIALGEKLCRMESSPELQKIEGLTDASSKMKTEKNIEWDDGNEDFINVISEMVANSISEEPEGQMALKAVHRFVSYNSDWVRSSMSVSVLSNDIEILSNTIKPWDSTTFEDPSPFESVEHINGILFSTFLDIQIPSKTDLKCIFQHANPNLSLLLLQRRIEHSQRKKNSEKKKICDEMENLTQKTT